MIFFVLFSHTPSFYFFFFNDTATTEIYTLSLHDALPISIYDRARRRLLLARDRYGVKPLFYAELDGEWLFARDRKSTRLNSSHSQISYAVFCLKKKKTMNIWLEYKFYVLVCNHFARVLGH